MLSEEREKICSLFCKDNENQKESAELIREEEKERERYCEKMENREEREARVRSESEKKEEARNVVHKGVEAE